MDRSIDRWVGKFYMHTYLCKMYRNVHISRIYIYIYIYIHIYIYIYIYIDMQNVHVLMYLYIYAPTLSIHRLVSIKYKSRSWWFALTTPLFSRATHSPA